MHKIHCNFRKEIMEMNYAYLAEDENSGTSKVGYTVSENLVENCDRLRN